MNRYIALLAAMTVLGFGMYAYMTGHPVMGGWVIFGSLFLTAFVIGELINT